MVAGTQTTPSRVMARGEAVQALHAALHLLPEHYREAIWLVHIEGTPVKEAAAKLQRSERAIHGLCRRGLKLLQAELKSLTRYI